jgi:hypothetical protein
VIGASLFGSTKFSSLEENLVHCADVKITSPGAWFVFQAKQTRFVQARAWDLSSRVTIYTGECDDPQCVTANSAGIAICGPQPKEPNILFLFMEKADSLVISRLR